eukprot:NP_491138.2 SULfate Permease family [Caenorhabditis elegans]
MAKHILSPIGVNEGEILAYDVNVTQNYTKSRQADVINQTVFDKTYLFKPEYLSLTGKIAFHLKSIGKWKRKEWIQFARGRIPITMWLPRYTWKSNFLVDFLGGLMVSVLSVPQSLAYGMLVGVPPSYGLITGIIGPIIYALFGTSKHSSPGAFAIVSLMVGTVVESFGDVGSTNGTIDSNVDLLCCRENKPRVSDGDAIGIAASVTLLVGLFQILFGLLNAGLLAVWLSDQLVQGLISGAAVHVLTSQLKSMTRISNVPPTSEPFQNVVFYMCFFKQMPDVDYASIIISVICVVLLLISTLVIDPWLCKKVPVKFPMELVLVVSMTLTVHYTRNTAYEFQIPTVGQVTSGIPAPVIPPMRNAFGMMGSAMSIAIISFVIHISLCKLISKKLQYVVNSNQEWFALGLMHTTSSFFGCFAGGSSLGRTMMQVKCGTKSQLSTLITSIVLIIFVCGGAVGCIQHLPKPVLASIVVVAMKDLFIQIFTCFALRKLSFVDYLIFAATFISVIVLNVNFGLLIGVVFELLTVVLRSQWADSSLLGRITGTNHYRRLGLYETANDIPGIKIFRFDSPIYFGNSEMFVRKIHQACGLNPLIVRGELETENKKKDARKEKEEEDAEIPKETEKETKLEVTTHQAKVLDEKHAEPEPNPADQYERLTHIIIDCSTIIYVDLMGQGALKDVYNDYKTIGISVLFANTNEHVRQNFETSQFFEEVPRGRMFVSVSDAVDQAELEQRHKTETVQTTAAPKATVVPPVAKSVGQKSVPITEPVLVPIQSSASLVTGIDFSMKENTAKGGKFPNPTRKLRVPSKLSLMEELEKTDKTQ